jgi:DNA polymerase III subunit gamma/tau
MQHQTLYRKYRPQNFNELRGQSNVVTLFENILKTGKAGHAYLFTGGRGTGKTSVARIVARELGTNPEDIYEIDAASNRGIDEIRTLRDGVHTLPFSSKYKVYIIDEAHMLTIQAANALLKTLEEPPAHCIFILATTDKQKLPATILSRCQIVDFKNADKNILSEMIMEVVTKEGYSITVGAADILAELGDGSYRDTYSLLETVLGSVDGTTIKEEDVRSTLKTPESARLLSVLEHISNGKTEEALGEIRELGNSTDSELVLLVLISQMRMAILLRFDTSGAYKKELLKKVSTEDIERLQTIGSSRVKPLTSESLILAIDTLGLIKKSGKTGLLPIELLIIKLSSE